MKKLVIALVVQVALRGVVYSQTLRTESIGSVGETNTRYVIDAINTEFLGIKFKSFVQEETEWEVKNKEIETSTYSLDSVYLHDKIFVGSRTLESSGNKVRQTHFFFYAILTIEHPCIIETSDGCFSEVDRNWVGSVIRSPGGYTWITKSLKNVFSISEINGISVFSTVKNRDRANYGGSVEKTKLGRHFYKYPIEYHPKIDEGQYFSGKATSFDGNDFRDYERSVYVNKEGVIRRTRGDFSIRQKGDKFKIVGVVIWEQHYDGDLGGKLGQYFVTLTNAEEI